MDMTVDHRFRTYCEANGLHILRQLQIGADDLGRCSSVFLVLDTDGLVKVFKELKAPTFEQSKDAIAWEDEMYKHLGNLSALPRYYGLAEIDQTLSFMRFGVCYGQSLADYITPGNRLTRDEACLVVRRVAQALAQLHARNVAYLDVRPENIKLDGSEVHLLDVGDARLLEHPTAEVKTHVHDPRYTPPETKLHGVAGIASDVFQLGVLFHQLLTGEHPFSEAADTLELERLPILATMLDADPSKRPTAAQVAQALGTPTKKIVQRGRPPIPEANGSVLFPARLGIPHRGHIDFMARLLELGYRLVVSLQASYVLSNIDPIPKWLALKMVGQALKAKGFDPNTVRFLCTPLYHTDEQHRLHFCLLPGAEDITAVASGNGMVHEMFGGRYPIIDQDMVFAAEGEPYETRSWGARLRHAIRSDDRQTFHELVAEGTEEVLTFGELRHYCLDTPPLDFTWGHGQGGQVLVLLKTEQEEILLKRRVGAYSTPEDTLLRELDGRWLDRFARESRFEMRGKEHRLRYERVELDADQNQLIHYTLITPAP
jgi:hypothetical protein